MEAMHVLLDSLYYWALRKLDYKSWAMSESIALAKYAEKGENL